MATDASPPDPGVLPPETHIGRVALRVADITAVTTFYRDVVGLTVLETTDSRTVLGAGDTPLVVLESAPDADARPASSAGLFHTAIRVPTRAALGDALARIRAEWRLDGASDHRVSEALYLTDPEGNGVEIYHDRPPSEWPRRDDGRVRITTEPLDLDPIETAAAGDQGVPPETDVGHVHLEVTDLEAFRAFYVDTLGFTEQTALPNASFVSAGGYHHHLGANTWHHRSTPSEGRGLAWVELVVPTDEALAAVRTRLTTHDVAVTALDTGVEVDDPDGIPIRLRVESA